jgi:hypothetical protein
VESKKIWRHADKTFCMYGIRSTEVIPGKYKNISKTNVVDEDYFVLFMPYKCFGQPISNYSYYFIPKCNLMFVHKTKTLMVASF